MKRRKFGYEIRSGGNPGGSSLMVIFAVLCLTVFAVLALSTVLADARLADACAANVTARYEADTAAEEVIAGLRKGNIPENVECCGNIYSFSFPVTDTRTMFVTVRVNGENDWQMLSRTTRYTADWQADEELDLWDGP